MMVVSLMEIAAQRSAVPSCYNPCEFYHLYICNHACYIYVEDEDGEQENKNTKKSGAIDRAKLLLLKDLLAFRFA